MTVTKRFHFGGSPCSFALGQIFMYRGITIVYVRLYIYIYIYLHDACYKPVNAVDLRRVCSAFMQSNTAILWVYKKRREEKRKTR